MKHELKKSYTYEEILDMYGEEFFRRVPPRPSKQKIQTHEDFDQHHKDIYSKIVFALEQANGGFVEVWAFGSRVRGNWMLPEEDPKGGGSDWDVFTTATTLPDANMLESAGLSDIRIDFRKGGIPPKEAVRVPS